MIKSISGYGFEGYSDKFKIELSKGLNVITGPSDSGKSSVIKLLSWIAKNRPKGDNFRNESLKPKELVSGKIVLEDGSWVVREKNKTVNQYQISSCEDSLKALRADVPDEVTEITHLKSVNIQRQHPEDQYFLLLDSPGQVAKKFNKVIGLEAMGEAVKAINGKVSFTNQSISSLNEDIKEHKESIKSLSWVKDAEKKMKVLLNLEEEIESMEEDYSEIEELITNFIEVQGKLDNYNLLPEAEKELNYLFLTTKKIDDKIKKHNEIKKLVLAVINVDKKINDTTALKNAENDFLSIKNELNILKKKKSELALLEKNISVLKIIDIKINETEESINGMEKILKKELMVCPLCGRRDK